jgi:hypothetical protein
MRVSASFSVARCSSPMQIRALNHLAVEFQHQAQHAVGRRVLRPKFSV